MVKIVGTVTSCNGKVTTLKQVSRGVYHLATPADPRCRWGTLAEINEDIAHFQLTGCLPHAKTSWA